MYSVEYQTGFSQLFKTLRSFSICMKLKQKSCKRSIQMKCMMNQIIRCKEIHKKCPISGQKQAHIPLSAIKKKAKVCCFSCIKYLNVSSTASDSNLENCIEKSTLN